MASTRIVRLRSVQSAHTPDPIREYQNPPHARQRATAFRQASAPLQRQIHRRPEKYFRCPRPESTVLRTSAPRVAQVRPAIGSTSSGKKKKRWPGCRIIPMSRPGIVVRHHANVKLSFVILLDRLDHRRLSRQRHIQDVAALARAAAAPDLPRLLPRRQSRRALPAFCPPAVATPTRSLRLLRRPAAARADVPCSFMNCSAGMLPSAPASRARARLPSRISRFSSSVSVRCAATEFRQFPSRQTNRRRSPEQSADSRRELWAKTASCRAARLADQHWPSSQLRHSACSCEVLAAYPAARQTRRSSTPRMLCAETSERINAGLGWQSSGIFQSRNFRHR